MFTNHNYLWIFPIILIAGLVSYLLYFKKLKALALQVKIILFSLKFASLVLIGFLLLQPFFIKSSTKQYPSRVILAVDVSQSVKAKADTNLILNKIKEFETYNWKNLKFETVFFGGSVQDTFEGFNQSHTNIQELIQHIHQSYPSYSVPHLILLTDGIVNSGSEINYLNSEENKIHTLLVGDTLSVSRVKINSVYHNKIGFLNNDFEVNYELLLQKLKNENIVLKWFLDDTLQYQKKINVNANEQLMNGSFFIKSKKSGLRNVRLKIENSKGELIKKKDSFIKIINNKKKILLSYSQPHPDLGAIQSALKNYHDYEVKTLVSDQLMLEDLTWSNLDIFVGLPSQEHWKLLRKSASNVMLFISQIPKNNIQNPFISIQVNNSKTDEVLVSKTQQNYLKLDPAIIANLPPVNKINATYNLFGDKISVWNCRYGTLETDKPLLQFTTLDNQKVGVFWGSGIWRWNLTNNDDQKQFFNSWINQLIAYLTAGKQDDRLQIQHKDWYYENEKISFLAWLYFKNLDFNPDAELVLSIWNKKQKSKYKMFLNQNKYMLNINDLKPGEYTYELKSLYAMDTLKVEGKFVVSEQNIELEDTQAKWNDLNNLSKKTLGKSILLDNFNELLEEINTSDYPVIESTLEQKVSVLNSLLLFFLIIVLWISEWMVRKLYLSV